MASNSESAITEHSGNINSDGKNKYTVVCLYCDTCILSANTGTHVAHTHSLPQATQRKDQPHQNDEVQEWWQVDDMFTFENIAFSNTLEETKYLVCANCERGPVGYHHIASKKSYVALSRVKHVPDSEML